jgi:hypothetical protein
MKRIFFVLLLAIVGSGLFAQATDAQIRQTANTLGVPYEALKKLVDSYKSQNGPSGATSITIDDPKDIPFLHDDPRIKVGGTYVITFDGWFCFISGTYLYVGLEPSTREYIHINLKSRIMEDYKQGDKVRVVLLFKPTSSFPKLSSSYSDAELVSIQKR